MVCTLKKNKVYYTDEGKGPAVLFLPGPDARPRVWHHQVPELSGSFRVLRLDFSGIDAGAATLHDLIAIIDEFTLFKELRQVFVAGCGVGGYLACAYALRHPGMTNGVIVSSVCCMGSVTDTIRYYLPEYQSPKNSFLRTIDGLLGKKDRSYFLYRLYSLLKNEQYLLTEMSSLMMPLLIINGEKESEEVHRLSAALAAAGEGITMEVIEGADKLPNEEQPDRYNMLVEDFIHSNISPL